MGKLNGNVAIITGGARGQGASHARKFISEGSKVVITDILEEDGQNLARELGDNALFIKHDVTNEDDWHYVIEKTEDTFGPVNTLINNAGVFIVKDIADMSEQELRKVLDINLIGTFLGMKSALPSLKKSNKATVINISSIDGLRGEAGKIAYNASKFAVRGITKTAALEFAEYGIRVNSIHPGLIETPMIETDDAQAQATIDEYRRTIPLKRAADPNEVSKMVLFLASDDSSYSTGSEFTIDGGITASN